MDNDYLAHYGVLGMKWGVRRYQNPDGTRTALGKKRERKGYEPDESKRTATRKRARNAAVAVGATAAGLAAAAGGRKMGKEKAKNLGKEFFTQNQKDGKDKPSISPAEKAVKNAKSAGEAASRVAGRIEGKKKSQREAEELKKRRAEYAKLSDDELRKRINRLELERRYDTLTNEDLALGKWTVQEKIDLATDVASIVIGLAGIGATVYTTIKKAGG